MVGAAPRVLVQAMKRMPDEERLRALNELRETSPATPSMTRQLRRADLIELESAGIEVGDHTMTHPCLPMCSLEKVRSEITQSRAVLSEILGRPPRFFAYPNGDWDRRAMAELEASRYAAAFLFDHRLADVPAERPLAISRVRANASDSIDRLRIVLSGLHPAIYHRRRVARSWGASENNVVGVGLDH